MLAGMVRPGQKTYSALRLGFAGDGSRHRLECDRCNDARHAENRFGHVVPVIEVFLEDIGAGGKRRGLGADDIALSSASC